MSPSLDESELLVKFKEFFKQEIINNHLRNTKKLKKLKEFKINEFTWRYLAKFFTGNDSARSLAQVLVYPRILGTSITTTFGTQMQKFITANIPWAEPSVIDGLDIEFIDQIVERKKYCQLKSGPNALNNDDVKTIIDKFSQAKNRARTNNLSIPFDDFVFCLLYGKPEQKNSFVLKLEKEYTVYMGKEFWHRLTGKENFYDNLIDCLHEIINDVNDTETIEEVIQALSNEISQQIEEDIP